MKKINRALISVSDKTGLADFAKELVSFGVDIISTGGTANLLRNSGVNIRDVSDLTGFPEMLGGRVKTLHPNIHGGILAIRDNPDHKKQTDQNSIQMIDLIVCNLYPFEDTVAQPDVSLRQAIEKIDIGGPTMIRAAAKNYRDVTVLTSIDQYSDFLSELAENSGAVSETTRFELAKSAFMHTASYDQSISSYFSGLDEVDEEFPSRLELSYEKVQHLRYGENPHQPAAFYREIKKNEPCAAWANQLSGQPISYNNLLDLEAATEIVKDFPEPACTLIKHNNPCGLATSDNLGQAFLNALDCDRTSAFGSIVGFNRPVDLLTANTLRAEAKSGIKIEAIIAPSYTPKALKALARVKSRRILEIGALSANTKIMQLRHMVGGLLVQDRDEKQITVEDLQFVTRRKPSEPEIQSLLFAWKACKHVKSNAILLAKGTQSIGIGAGQMSRVDSTLIAIRKAGERISGSVLASDAYFPFSDGVEAAGQAGVIAIIQPGGSVNDESVIKMADHYKIAMAFTGFRHFKH